MGKSDYPRISINVHPDIFELLAAKAEEKDIPRAHLAGDIIHDYFRATEKPKDADLELLEYKISMLESESVELKKDKTFLQGEISRLTGAIVHQLPEPKGNFNWRFWKK